MIRLIFSRGDARVGEAEIFGGRVVSVNGDACGLVVGVPEYEVQPILESPPHGMSIEVVHDDQSMHEQALFRRPR